MAEKEKFDPESKLRELLPNAFDDKGEYKPIYTPTGEPKGSVSVEPAPSSFDEVSPELVAAGTGILGFLGGQKAKMIQQRVQPPARVSAPPPSTVPPPVSTSPASGAPLSPGDKWNAKVVGSMGPGGESSTEAARNYRIQQSLTPTETAQFKTNREGIILPNKTEAEQRMMQEARQKMLSERAKRAAEATGRGMGVATDIAPRLMTGIGAASAGYQGTDAYNRLRNRDIPGAVLSGVGALGSVASMVPHPLTRGIGTALGIVSPLALQAYDAYRGE
jgi:hypothetical protein